MLRYKIIKENGYYYPLYESSHGWSYFQGFNMSDEEYKKFGGPGPYMCFKKKDKAIEFMEEYLERHCYSVTVWQAEGS